MRVPVLLFALLAICVPAWSQASPMLDRLEHMSPEQRQRVLNRLPPERARKLQQRLDRLDRMTPAQRARLQQSYDRFRQLPPDRQDAMRRSFQQYNNLPPNRQDAVRQELNALRGMNETERRRRIMSDQFQSRFRKGEQKLIEEMSAPVRPN